MFNTKSYEKERSISLCTINICGLSARSKFMIENYAHSQKLDIISIQETCTNNIEKLKLDNMVMISDTNQARNRGVALYVKSGYTCTCFLY